MSALIMDYLKVLPAEDLDQLYQSVWACQAVFRCVCRGVLDGVAERVKVHLASCKAVRHADDPDRDRGDTGAFITKVD